MRENGLSDGINRHGILHFTSSNPVWAFLPPFLIFIVWDGSSVHCDHSRWSLPRNTLFVTQTPTVIQLNRWRLKF